MLCRLHVINYALIDDVEIWGIVEEEETCDDGILNQGEERIDCGGLARQGLLCRISLSPSGTKVCFEHQIGHKFREWGHAIYIADFDVNKRAITNPRVIANKARSSGWFAYPRWTPDEAAVVYHANTAGKGALFLYSLKDGSTRRVSTNPAADYRYPHCEATPK